VIRIRRSGPARDQRRGQPVSARRNRLAIASLVLAILWLGGLGSLIAVVLAWVALTRIRRRSPDTGGAGLARIGLALGIIGLVVTLGVIGLAVAVTSTKVGPVTLRPPSSYGLDMALSPDGSVAYITEPTSNRLVVLNAHTGATTATVTVGDTPTGLAVSPDGAQVWVVDTQLGNGSPGASESVTVVATDTNSVIGTISTPIPGSLDVAFSPDGRRAYVTNNGLLASGSVSVIDTSDLSVVGTLSPAVRSPKRRWNPTSAAVSPDGRHVWVSDVNVSGSSSGAADELDVFDATTDRQIARIPVGSGPFFLALSGDGHDAYVADKLSCAVQEIDTVTLKVVATVHWPPSRGCPYGIAAGPQDNIVYVVTGNDHTIDEGRPGNAFGSVNFTTLRADVENSVGIDPVTVTLSRNATIAFVVDADRPQIDLVHPTTGVIESTLALPAMASTTTVAGFP